MTEPLLLEDYTHLYVRLRWAQRNRCYLCDKWLARGVTIDHVVPRSKGGTDHRNRLLACDSCNRRKSNRDPYPCERLYLSVALEELDANPKAINFASASRSIPRT